MNQSRVAYLERRETFRGGAQILLAALLWSSAGLLIRGVPCDIFWMLAIRNGAACLALMPGLRVTPGVFLRRAWPTALLYALFMLAFAISTRWVGAAQAVAGQYTAPLFTYAALAARKKLRIRFANALPMVLIGLGGAAALIGDGISLLSFLPLAGGVLFALYAAFLHRVRDVPESAIMCIGNFFCVVIALLFVRRAPLPAADSAVLIALAGVLVNAFGYTIYARGTRGTEPLTGIMLCLAEPVLNPIWVWLFLGEAPAGAALVSLLLTLSGGVLNILFQAARRRAACARGGEG